MKHSPRGSRAVLAVLALAGIAATAGCAGSTGAAPSSSASVGQLPQKYMDAGMITASTICGGAPYSFGDPGSTEAKGLFADIATAWGEELGVTVDPIGMEFDSILPSTASGRFDVVLAIGDTKERQEQFDFIDILTSSYAIVVSPDSDVSEPLDLCGLTVTSTVGSLETQEVQKLSAECSSKGKPAITNVELGDLGATYLAVSSGRADAAWGSDASSYKIEADTPDLYKVAFEVPSDSVFAIAIPKTNPELRDAIAVAVSKIMANGKYEAILDEYNLSTQAVDGLMINREPAEIPGT